MCLECAVKASIITIKCYFLRGGGVTHLLNDENVKIIPKPKRTEDPAFYKMVLHIDKYSDFKSGSCSCLILHFY